MVVEGLLLLLLLLCKSFTLGTTGSVKVFYTWDNWIGKSLLHLGQLDQ